MITLAKGCPKLLFQICDTRSPHDLGERGGGTVYRELDEGGGREGREG